LILDFGLLIPDWRRAREAMRLLAKGVKVLLK
jgi:hypothetical protein